MSSRKHTVLVGRYMTIYLGNPLQNAGDFTVINFDEFCDNTEKYANDIEGIILIPYDLPSLTDELISSLPNLKVISVHGAGVDGLDVERLYGENIRMGNTPQAIAEPTADIAILLMLATARKLKEAMKITEQATAPEESGLFTLSGRSVTGATLGILGMGNIGYCIAKRAVGFRMKILYHNRTRRSKVDEERVDAKYCSSMEQLLQLSDFVTIAVPLTTETTKLIGQKELALMKPTSILINVARGRVVDTDAVVDALQNGTISAAGLDVTEPEPLPRDHPLCQMENVVLSGHSGTSTVECRAEMLQHAIASLRAGLTGGVMINEVLPK